MQQRGGTTLLEVVVSAALLAAVASMCVQLVLAIGLQRRAADRRAWAVEAAANVLERLTARDWEEITPQAADEMELAPGADEVLPGARLEIDVVPQQDTPPAKRITLGLTWTGKAGKPARPVRLVTWIYQPEAQEP